jgi:hypothetical protein
MAKKIAKNSGTPSVPTGRAANGANYPRHSSLSALRIPKAILDQNAGKECTDPQAGLMKMPEVGEIGVVEK